MHFDVDEFHVKNLVEEECWVDQKDCVSASPPTVSPQPI